MPSTFLSSPIGKKMGMALTGLILYGFLVGHLTGNLLLLKDDGGRSFNAYSDFLINHPCSSLPKSFSSSSSHCTSFSPLASRATIAERGPLATRRPKAWADGVLPRIP